MSLSSSRMRACAAGRVFAKGPVAAAPLAAVEGCPPRVLLLGAAEVEAISAAMRASYCVLIFSCS